MEIFCLCINQNKNMKIANHTSLVEIKSCRTIASKHLLNSFTGYMAQFGITVSF